jgi:hypothetical protein
LKLIIAVLALLFMSGMAYADKQVVRRAKKATIYHDSAWPANKYQAVFTIHDQNYQDENGTWNAAVEDFEIDVADGFDMKAEKMNHKIRVMSSTARRWYPRRNVNNEYVSISQIEYYTNRWRTLSPGPLNHFMNKLYWESDDIRVEIVPLWNRMKFNAILKTTNAPTRMRILQSLSGLTFSTTTWKFTSQSDGKVVGSLVPLTAIDASSTTVIVTTLTYSGYIEFAVNTSGKTLPIIVDPSYSVQPDETAGIDNYLQAGALAGMNRGTIEYMNVCTSTAKRPVIKFDLSGMAAGVTITAATISLWSLDTVGSQTNSLYSILSANSSWTEAGSMWNYRVGTTRWAGDAASDGGTDAGCSVSGTDYNSSALASRTAIGTANAETQFTCDASQVQAWYGGANYGLVMINNSSTDKQYASSDNATSGYRPKIAIDYTEPTAATTTRRRAGRGFGGFR